MENFDKALIYISSCLLVISGYLLIDDSFIRALYFSHLKLEEAGQISNLENNVRRRSITHTFWLDLNLDDKLYVGDHVFTGDNSQLDFKLNGDSDYILEPNSLIIIKKFEDSNSIQLKWGSLSARVSKQTKIPHVENSYFTVAQDSYIKLQREKNGSTHISIIRGSLSFFDQSGGLKTKLNPNVSAIIDSEHDVVTYKKIPLIGVKPKDESHIWQVNDNALRIDFNKKLFGYRLYVANDPFFKNIVINQPIFDSYADVNISKEGRYYWKVVDPEAKADEMQSTDVRKFHIFNNSAPQTVYPKDKSIVYTVIDENDARSPSAVKTGFSNFSWKTHRKFQYYAVEVAKDPNFKSLVLSESTYSSEMKSPSLAEGQYYWRVKGVNKERELPWSEVREFKIKVESPGKAKLDPITPSKQVIEL